MGMIVHSKFCLCLFKPVDCEDKVKDKLNFKKENFSDKFPLLNSSKSYTTWFSLTKTSKLSKVPIVQSERVRLHLQATLWDYLSKLCWHLRLGRGTTFCSVSLHIHPSQKTLSSLHTECGKRDEPPKARLWNKACTTMFSDFIANIWLEIYQYIFYKPIIINWE